jgi:hypothetical protein
VIASAFQLRPFADDLESAFNPISGTRAIHPGHLELIALWGLVAAAFALLAFRWEPGGRERGGGGLREPAMAAAGRLRRLLEPRHLPEALRRRDDQPRLRRREDRSRLPHREDRSLLAGGRGPHQARRTAVEARTERIEGPAPAEDSSVPPEPAATPPADPALHPG